MTSEMTFENVNDDGWTTDAWLYYKLTYEPLAIFTSADKSYLTYSYPTLGEDK